MDENKGRTVDSIAAEGDPNEVPYKNPNGPRVEWARADSLQVGEKVQMLIKYIYTVARSVPADGASGTWSIVLSEPNLPNLPHQKSALVRPSFLYRRIVDSKQ